MNCAWIRRSLSAYLDEKTAAAERLKIGLHLNQCRECRHTYEELRRIRLALLDASAEPVPPEFSQAWRARLHKDFAAAKPAAAGRAWRRSLVLAPAAASLLLVSAGLALYWPRSHADKAGRSSRANAMITGRSTDVGDGSPSAPDRTDGAKTLTAPAGGSAPSPPPGGNSGGSWQGAADSGAGSGSASIFSKTIGSPRPSVDRAHDGAASTLRLNGQAAPAIPSEEAHNGVGLKVDDSWRLWLLAVGPRQASLRRVLVSLGLPELADGSIPLEAPLLLWEDLTYNQAKSLAQAIEDAGGRAMVELAP